MKFLIATISVAAALAASTFGQAGGDESLPVYLEQDSIYTEVKSPFATQSAGSSFDGTFPSYGAIHHTSKFAASVSSQGILGAPFIDPATDELALGFEFPYGSGIDYLCRGGLWVGGLIGSDTLVSVANCTEIEIADGVPSIYTLNEMFPPTAYTSMRAIEPFGSDTGSCFRALFVDTFTYGLPNLNPPASDVQHVPMNLSIVQKSYTRNDYPYRNIMLLDYIITNIGQSQIRDAYVGFYVDGDVVDSDDDLAGSFRDLSTAYIFDSDANLVNSTFAPSSPTAAMGTRPVMTYPPVTDTNFNWWGSYFPIDFGPRREPSELDPYRDFGDGLIGTPTGDGNKYYLMSHPEWDYDQVMTTLVPFGDNEWLDPDVFQAMDYANGKDARFLMSVGPVDIMPDSAIRVVFGLFAGELVHIDPNNIYRLAEGDYVGYYDGLFFDVFRANAERARWFVQEVLDPTLPPTGLTATILSDDEFVISWDRWVLPDVSGYNLTLIDPSYSSSVLFVPAGENSVTISDVEPGGIYIARISHVGDFGQGQTSLPITIQIPVLSSTPEPVAFETETVTYSSGASSVEFCWIDSGADNIHYYNIYKSTAAESAPATPTLYGSVLYPSTCYADTVPIDGALYYVTAVNQGGVESPFSEAVRATEVRTKAAELRQNYPNPFNASTSIYYQLDSPGSVNLEVFNILGQSVRKLVNKETQPTGLHSVVWDGTDEGGRVVSSGMYFYRLVTDGQTVCRKMVLLK